MEPLQSEYENKMTKEELLTSVGATNPTSAPKDVIDSITKGTIPDATPIAQEPPTAEEKKVTKGEIFQPSEQLMELLTTTGERKAQPIRNPASAFFNINSIDRYASATNTTAQFALLTESPTRLAANPASSYNMNLGRNLMSGYFHRLTVTDVNIQWNIPTICTQNYLITILVYDILLAEYASVVVTLPYGYYSFGELAAALQYYIRATFHDTAFPLDSLTVTWSQGGGQNAGSFVFQTKSDDFAILFSTTLPLAYTGVPQPGFPNEGRIAPGTSLTQAQRAMLKLYLMLGINSTLTEATENYEQILYTSPSYPTLIYTSYVDVISNKLSQFMRVKDSETSWSPDTSVITRIYLTNQGTITSPNVLYKDLSGSAPKQQIIFDEFAVGSRPFILNYTPNTPKNIKWSPDQAVVDFDIRVVDEYGDRVPWSLNTETTILNQPTHFQEFFEFQLTVLCSET